MLDLICLAIIILAIGYVVAMIAINEPEALDDIKSEANEAKKYFVSLRGNIF